MSGSDKRSGQTPRWALKYHYRRGPAWTNLWRGYSVNIRMTLGGMVTFSAALVAIVYIVNNSAQWTIWHKIVDKTDDHIKDWKSSDKDNPPKGGGSPGLKT